MRQFFLRLCALLSALGLPACDNDLLARLKPGVTTASEVRRIMGEPGMEWKNPDGGRTWEYTRQPEGNQCYMITLGPDEVLKSVEQVITPENQARVRPGMSKDDIRRLLGKPRSVQTYSLKQEEVWDWKVGKEVTTDVFFNVHFDMLGQVLTTSRSVDMK